MKTVGLELYKMCRFMLKCLKEFSCYYLLCRSASEGIVSLGIMLFVCVSSKRRRYCTPLRVLLVIIVCVTKQLSENSDRFQPSAECRHCVTFSLASGDPWPLVWLVLIVSDVMTQPRTTWYDNYRSVYYLNG